MLKWITKIRVEGDSRFISLPEDLLRETQWRIGDELVLTVADGYVELHSNRKPSLKDLMANVPEGGLPSVEELIGLSSPIKAVGREV
ncbi:AbrB/MazE/SpoVT family DNA-binding domain-containing protein [Saccharospirillum alexandrii]|uniref:AbrB/MazE/SpoVT family DNA-binding domain-containing protein n=1 Tax=Saccharospirillum alexandrii TaxID=2448477 RepID=UPI000FD7735E|nr:hypothetical protein [Saccharospirillum alexandrii]